VSWFKGLPLFCQVSDDFTLSRYAECQGYRVQLASGLPVECATIGLGSGQFCTKWLRALDFGSDGSTPSLHKDNIEGDNDCPSDIPLNQQCSKNTLHYERCRAFMDDAKNSEAKSLEDRGALTTGEIPLNSQRDSYILIGSVLYLGLCSALFVFLFLQVGKWPLLSVVISVFPPGAAMISAPIVRAFRGSMAKKGKQRKDECSLPPHPLPVLLGRGRAFTMQFLKDDPRDGAREAHCSV